MATMYLNGRSRRLPTTDRDKRLLRETACDGGGIVITARYADGGYETRVISDGPLDGWTLPASTERQADRLHDRAVKMVEGANREDGW